MHTTLPDFLYQFNYDLHHKELSLLESRQVFGEEHHQKCLFSRIKLDPSLSPFIKCRIDLICWAPVYDEFLKVIEEKQILMHGFHIDYVSLEGDPTGHLQRRKIAKEVGHCIQSEPNFKHPSTTYSVCQHEGAWYFGVLWREDNAWMRHNEKPFSFSNSIDMHIAKTLVSIASKGDVSCRLLDACCGVGTVLLEACIAGFDIEGCDIGLSACQHTRSNLLHFGYKAKVHHLDIKDLDQNYHSAVIDLPYNLYSHSTVQITSDIIESTAKLSERLVIVSIADIQGVLEGLGLDVLDGCRVVKKGKSLFERTLWVCQKRE